MTTTLPDTSQRSTLPNRDGRDHDRPVLHLVIPRRRRSRRGHDRKRHRPSDILRHRQGQARLVRRNGAGLEEKCSAGMSLKFFFIWLWFCDVH